MCCNLENVFQATTRLIDFTPITHANHVHARKQMHALYISLSLSNAHTHRQLQSDLIFTLINSINKACRGRIYTHDYIGLIKKEEEEAGEGGK